MLRHYCGAELDRFYPEPIEDCPICEVLARDARRCYETLKEVCKLRDWVSGCATFPPRKFLSKLNKILGGLT